MSFAFIVLFIAVLFLSVLLIGAGLVTFELKTTFSFVFSGLITFAIAIGCFVIEDLSRSKSQTSYIKTVQCK